MSESATGTERVVLYTTGMNLGRIDFEKLMILTFGRQNTTVQNHSA